MHCKLSKQHTRTPRSPKRKLQQCRTVETDALLHSAPSHQTHDPNFCLFDKTLLHLLQSKASKVWQNESSLVDLRVVVSEVLVLLLLGERADWLAHVAGSVLGADHEADLAGWVGWNGGVRVLDGWEDLLAVLLELGDQWKMEPLVLGWSETESVYGSDDAIELRGVVKPRHS